MKVNLGCGSAYVRGWTNVDASADVRADIHLSASDFIELHGHETTQLYMGHFIEHLRPADASALLQDMVARLPAGAEVSAVVPDIRQIFRAYESGEMNNRELNEWYIYSYIQPSHHVWCHDLESLMSLLREAGFEDVVPIEPSTWPPVWHKEGLGARFQSGARGTVPASARAPAVSFPLDAASAADGPDIPGETGTDAIDSSDEASVAHINRLVRMVAVDAYRRNDADTQLAAARSQIDAIVRSRSYRLAFAARRVVRALIPTGTIRARLVRSTVTAAQRLAGQAHDRD